jgi:hypothetical protein
MSPVGFGFSQCDGAEDLFFRQLLNLTGEREYYLQQDIYILFPLFQSYMTTGLLLGGWPTWTCYTYSWICRLPHRYPHRPTAKLI